MGPDGFSVWWESKPKKEQQAGHEQKIHDAAQYERAILVLESFEFMFSTSGHDTEMDGRGEWMDWVRFVGRNEIYWELTHSLTVSEFCGFPGMFPPVFTEVRDILLG